MPDAQNLETNENGKKVVATGGDESTNSSNTSVDSAVDDNSSEDFSDPVKAMAEIKKLRAENAKHRTKNKTLDEQMVKVNGTMSKLKSALGLESEDQDPEEQVTTLKQQNEALQVQMAMNELVRENDIPRSGEKYFNFLIAQEFETLEEGEEISEERIAELAKETKKMFAGGSNHSTGVKDSKANPNPDASASSISAAQFAKMNNGEKSALYVKDSALYQKLFNEAKEKRLF